MDGEQAARWAAAQEGVGVGANLVPAALRQLEFLAAVDRRRWLYEGPLLDRAIRRYKACWLPLLAKHTQAAVVDGPLVVPLDCEWIWHCHRLNPVQYIRDCKKLYGRILNNNNVESSTQTKSKIQSEKVWTELYPGEPFELEYTSSSDTATDANTSATEGISYDLVSAVKRQSTFYYQVDTPTMHDLRFLEEALARYKGFLYLIKMNQDNGMQRFRVPTYDVDLMWHTHQLHPLTYCNDMLKLIGKVLEHDDTDADRSEGKKLDVGFTETTEQFESTFGVRYWKAGCMYRGNSPAPVTSTPQIFSSEADNGFSSCKSEKHLNVLELTATELHLQIVDIKNLPSAVQKENVHVRFNKNQPDKFISDGGSLDISTVTGKNTGAILLCEPSGELILTVMVDQGSKKPQQIGKISFPLHDLTGPDSKLSFERWFEQGHGVHATSPPVSLRVAASATVPSRVGQVLNMIRMEPFSLKTFLLRPSIKDQKISSGIRFVYDCGTELIRLQIREHKAKNGLAFRELVGVSKSPKQQFQLAEFKENKWTLKASNLSIRDGTDGCLLELKGDNQLIKLYQGKRLEFQRKCCGAHSEDASAVTAVKFCAEHPYGKAIALLDPESQFIIVNEDWFLLPWIAMSFLTMDADAKDGGKLMGSGAMVQKDVVSEPDTAMVETETETIGAGSTAAAPAQCGSCSTVLGDGKAMATCKDDHAGSGAPRVAVASGETNDHAESAGCGGGCGGNCGPVVVEDSKAENAKSGGGCGSGCGGGCGGGCSGSVFKASVVAGEGKAKSGGCGSGCGGGCGGAGGCGTMFKTSTVASEGQAKSGGCGSGCGGGCGTSIMEGFKTGNTRSGGCGSGCGGGCSAVIMEGSKAGNTRSGGCGSGCGGGCGAMIMEGSKAGNTRSGGCGSGCGGGCRNVIMEGSKAGNTRSGGCGSGCGGGCGALIMEGSKAGNTRSGGCGSGCRGGCGAGCGGGCGSVFIATA